MKFKPHAYQGLIIDHALDTPRNNTWAGMGMGKTVSMLTALSVTQMCETGPALVLAPKRVALHTWPAEQRTAGNRRLCLTVALSYGGRAEIVRAAQTLAAEVARGERSVDSIDEDAVQRSLFTADIPDPDLVIRTSGEKRISNFLLWQCAYAEFVFMDQLWPDFSGADLQSAIAEFSNRKRRYGAAG